MTATVLTFPPAGARAIDCAGCGEHFEAATPKRTALLYKAHRCGLTTPIDWENDDDIAGVVAVHLRLTHLELNNLLAYVTHPGAPRFIAEIGAKCRAQIDETDQ